MSSVTAATDSVIAVLLADGWHQIVPGSFSVGQLGLGNHIDPARQGFRFQETRPGSPYQPASLTGPLDSILAVRQVNRASTRCGDAVRKAAAQNGHQPDQSTRHTAYTQC